jgi:hypothetical protein
MRRLLGLGAERPRRNRRPITGGKLPEPDRSRKGDTRIMKARLLEEAVHCDQLAADADRRAGEAAGL